MMIENIYQPYLMTVAEAIDEAPGVRTLRLKFQDEAQGKAFTFKAGHSGPQWIEAEAQWPDGRRGFAVTNCFVQPE